MKNGRIYNLQTRRIVNRTRTNYSFTEDLDEKIPFSFEKVSEDRFYSSHSWKVFEPSSVEVTAIPRLISTTEIGMEKSGNNNVEWSNVNRETQTQERSVKVSIPPRSRIMVTFTVTQGFIDVPYSYKQRDIHIDGNHETRILEDGVFTGFNTIVDHVVSDPLPLPRTYEMPPLEDLDGVDGESDPNFPSSDNEEINEEDGKEYVDADNDVGPLAPPS